MLYTLKDYIHRSLPEEGPFATNPNLAKKVDASGAFLPFIGNTTVFLLDESTKNQLSILQDRLYEAVPGMLARRLEPATFHMTLHDLLNGAPGTPGLPERIPRMDAQVRDIMRRRTDASPLRMRGTWVFNMVNTSLVLGLEPVDEATEQRLSEMYNQLDAICPLSYGLTPHITLAYFRPGIYDPQQVQALRSILGPAELSIDLLPENLVLQHFDDMNHYFEI